MIINTEQDSTGEHVPTSIVDEPEAESKGVNREPNPMSRGQVNLLLLKIGSYLESRIPTNASEGLSPFAPLSRET